MPIIQLTPKEQLVEIEGKIRIRKEDISAYFVEVHSIKGEIISKENKVYLKSGINFRVVETPEEIDKLLEED